MGLVQGESGRQSKRNEGGTYHPWTIRSRRTGEKVDLVLVGQKQSNSMNWMPCISPWIHG
eukprot:scaffold431_cov334-Pavlova_lutheri.AAC.117